MTHLTQHGLVAQDFHTALQEEAEEEVEEVEDHLQPQEEEIQMIEVMAQS